MKGIIVYKSKYGATRQYAEWLGEEVAVPVLTPEQATASKIQDADFVIAGCSVYIGKLKIKNWLNQHLHLLKNKKLFLFIVCGTPSGKKEKLQELADNNIPALLKDQCQVFFLHGRMFFKDISLTDRLLLKLGARLVSDPEEKAGMVTEFDDVKKENLTGLLLAIRNYLYHKEAPAEAVHHH